MFSPTFLALLVACAGLLMKKTSAACNADEFRCLDGQCVLKTWRCDGDDDCEDDSDEIGCAFCKQNEFQCKNNESCVNMEYRCDSDNDCPDGSDEEHCGAPEKVKDLKLASMTEYQATVTWKEPTLLNGNDTKYNVKCQYHEIVATSKYQTVVPCTFNISGTEAVIYPMDKSSYYIVSVRAINDVFEFEGEMDTIVFSNFKETPNYLVIIISSLLGVSLTVNVLLIIRSMLVCFRPNMNTEEYELDSLPPAQPSMEDNLYENFGAPPANEDKRIGDEASEEANEYEELGPIAEYDDVGPPESRWKFRR